MRFKGALAAVCVAGSVLGLAQGAAAAQVAGGAVGTTVTGEVRRAVVELDPAPGTGLEDGLEDGHEDGHGVEHDRSVEVTVLRTAGGDVRVPTAELAGVPTGATVSAVLGRAVRAGRTPAERAESGRDVLSHRVLSAPRTTKAVSTAVRPVLPVLVTVPGVAADGTTTAALAAAVAETSRFYDHETRGAVTYTATAARSVTVAATAATSCDLGALERAVRAQVAVPAETTLLMYTPKVRACGFSGVAWIGSTARRDLALWLNGDPAAAVAAHEIGHNLGLGHSGSSAACSAGAADDGPASACSTVEYGDFFDVMGANAYASGSRTLHLGEMNAAQRDRLAGFGAGELTGVDAAATTSTALAPIGSASGTQALRFTSGGVTYYVELRAGAGRDAGLYPGGTYYGTTATGGTGWAPVPAGVTVRRLDGTGAGARSRLLEPRAAGAPFVLPAGASFTTADGRTAVTVTASSGTAATVRVAPRGTAAPTPTPTPTPTATPTATPTPTPTPTGAPGAPVLSAATAGDRSASFTVTAGGGTAVTGYVVTPYVAGAAQPALTLSTTATSTRITVNGLVNGRAHVFGVRVRGAAGLGPEARTAALTPSATATATPAGAVSVARGTRATAPAWRGPSAG